MPYLMGIDVGTTGVKAVLVDAAGTVVGSVTEEYPLYTPHPLWSEQDPADWWSGTQQALSRLVRESGVAAEEIAGRSRGTPRIANRILRRVRDVAEVRHEGVITTAVAGEALALLEVDDEGLEKVDRELLHAIAVRFSGGPVGLSTLAVSLGEEPDTIEDVYEPYLLQLGFIQRTPRGRVVTPLGRAHVGAPLADDGERLF